MPLVILLTFVVLSWTAYDLNDRREARGLAWELQARTPHHLAHIGELQWQLATRAVSRSVAVYTLCRISGVTPLEARGQLGLSR